MRRRFLALLTFSSIKRQKIRVSIVCILLYTIFDDVTGMTTDVQHKTSLH
jgi:hypothetical protein